MPKTKTARTRSRPRTKPSQPKTTNKKPSSQKQTDVRLQKFLAQAGYGSRRECETLITEGRVTVGKQVFKTLGQRVPPDCQEVRVDGNKVLPMRTQYFIVNKPTGVLSTCRDPEGRMRVIDLIKTDQRVYNVGRLDKSSEGLILVTNDGDLANRLTHPRYGVNKTYHVTVAGNPKWEDLEQLKRGIRLAEAVAKVSDVKIRKRRKDSTDLVIMLEEGRNREIRRLLAHIGHKVTRLQRVAIGPLQLGSLKPGDYRRLEPREIEALTKASSVIKGRKARKEKPVETSQLGRWKKKSKTIGKPSEGKSSDRKPSHKSGTGSSSRSGNKSRNAGSGADRKSPTRKPRTSDTKNQTAKKTATKKKSSTKKLSKKKTTKKKRVTKTTTASRRGAGRVATKSRKRKTAVAKRGATKRSAGKGTSGSAKRTMGTKKKTARAKSSKGRGSRR